MLQLKFSLFVAMPNATKKLQLFRVKDWSDVPTVHVMKPENCLSCFEAVLDCDGVELILPLEVAVDFFQQNIMEQYCENIDDFIEKLLYLEQIDFEYNTRQVITKMYEHCLFLFYFYNLN